MFKFIKWYRTQHEPLKHSGKLSKDDSHKRQDCTGGDGGKCSSNDKYLIIKGSIAEEGKIGDVHLWNMQLAFYDFYLFGGEVFVQFFLIGFVQFDDLRIEFLEGIPIIVSSSMCDTSCPFVR